MKISASVFSNKERKLESLVEELEACGMDFLHVDCNNDLSVDQAMGRMRAVSKLPIDLHIISEEPEKFYDMIVRHRVEMVTIQFEDLKGRVPELPDLGCKWGLSIVTPTPVAAFEAFQESCDFILFMTTVPGQSGGRFDKANFSKIRQFRKQFPRKRLHVVGGVNAEISFVLRNMGVYCAVSGSFLVKADSIPKAFLDLLVQKGENQLHVSDFMHELGELPVLNADQLETRGVLEAIESGKMGYCLVTDSAGKLTGLISNADLRRGMLDHIEDLSTLDVHSMVNGNPKSVDSGATISEMLRLVKSFEFLVMYLPVVDRNGMLVGAVNFNNLILGEL